MVVRIRPARIRYRGDSTRGGRFYARGLTVNSTMHRVSAVIGTHSHIPTADAQILPGGTAYQTDVGMCGDYDSVIGMKKEIAVQRFIKKMPGERLAPAEGEGTLCAAVVETDDRTGLAKSVRPLRLGGRLPPTA